MAKGIKTASPKTSMMARMMGVGVTKNAAVLSESDFFGASDMVRTRVPILNVALSGELDGGLTPGITAVAGPSKHFKSNIGLVLVSAYLRKHPDAVCLFFDNEFGSTPGYFKSAGVDPSRVKHIPFKDVEELKFEAIQHLESLERGDKVICFVDSIGNVASKKELQDAIDLKSAQDMSRAKQIKSCFRMITPYLTTIGIPMVVINHTYETQETYSKTIMSGGTGPMYSANTVFIIGRQQEKDGTELLGYNFIINIEKSRFIKEKSKLPVNVTFEGGINTYSGLLDVGLDIGFIVKPSNGWFSRAFLDKETGELVTEDKKWRRADTDCSEFWKPMFSHAPFKEAFAEHFKLKAATVDDETMAEIDDLFDGKAELPVELGRKISEKGNELENLENIDLDSEEADSLFDNLD